MKSDFENSDTEFQEEKYDNAKTSTHTKKVDFWQKSYNSDTDAGDYFKKSKNSFFKSA